MDDESIGLFYILYYIVYREERNFGSAFIFQRKITAHEPCYIPTLAWLSLFSLSLLRVSVSVSVSLTTLPWVHVTDNGRASVAVTAGAPGATASGPVVRAEGDVEAKSTLASAVVALLLPLPCVVATPPPAAAASSWPDRLFVATAAPAAPAFATAAAAIAVGGDCAVATTDVLRLGSPPPLASYRTPLYVPYTK